MVNCRKNWIVDCFRHTCTGEIKVPVHMRVTVLKGVGLWGANEPVHLQQINFEWHMHSPSHPDNIMEAFFHCSLCMIQVFKYTTLANYIYMSRIFRYFAVLYRTRCTVHVYSLCGAKASSKYYFSSGVSRGKKLLGHSIWRWKHAKNFSANSLFTVGVVN